MGYVSGSPDGTSGWYPSIPQRALHDLGTSSLVGAKRAPGSSFGVPPGVVFEPVPVDAPSAFDAAFVLAPHDLQRGIGVDQSARTSVPGAVELIAIAEGVERPMTPVPTAEALAGRGLRGDRYARGAGTFSDSRGCGYDLTLVEDEALEALAAGGVYLAPADARRNLVVRGVALYDLIGKRFQVGEVECFGQRLCEPCAHLERLTRPGVLRGLMHRGACAPTCSPMA